MAGLKHTSVMSLFWGAVAVSLGALAVSILTDPRDPMRTARRSARQSAGPRKVSNEPIDDAELNQLPTEDEARMAQTGGGGGYETCSYGWTFICDSHPPGQTCKSGYTFKCDTGTCTSGWTIWCDNRRW